MDELAGLLSRERVLLELLLFKLTSLRHLLAAGDARYLTWAGQEVDNATEAVRQAELHRALVITGLADERGVPPESLSLRVLAEDSDEPWRTIFAEQRAAFLLLAEEIGDATAATKRLATAGGAAIAQTLDQLSEGLREPSEGGLYGAGAAWERTIPAARVSWTL